MLQHATSANQKFWCINLQQTIFYSTCKKQARSIWKTSNVKKQWLPNRKLVKSFTPPNCTVINFKASHIKSFAHGQPPASQKHFLILCMNFDYCLQTEEKYKNNKKAFNCDNFYFLVIDCLHSQLNHIIVSMFLLESRQV